MNELVKIIETKEIVCPFNDKLKAEIYTDIPMGVASTLDKNNSEADNAFILIANIVKDWNLADSEGNKLPIDIEGVKRLPSKIASWLVEESTKAIQEDENKKKQ